MWALVLLLSCHPRVAAPAVAPPHEVSMNADAVRGVSDPALQALLSDHWEATLRAAPTWATTLGDHRYDDRLPDRSESGRLAWRDARLELRDRARVLPRDGLSDGDALTLDLLLAELDAGLEVEAACRFAHWSILPRNNVLTDLDGLPRDLEVRTPRDGANLLARYAAAPAWIDQAAEGLRLGLADGLVENAVSVGIVVTMLDEWLAQPDAAWVLAAPASAGHPDWNPTALEAWRTALLATLPPIRAALTRHRDLLRDEILPVARPQDRTGLGAMPLGPACYGAVVREHTTLDTTPAAVHRQGREALDAVHAEFRALGSRMWGTDDLAAIFARLRNDPALRFGTEDEIEDKARAALDRAAAAIPDWFGRLPQGACTVERIPDYEAPYTTIAYYRPGTPGERAGAYFVNTWAPGTRPRHEAEVLAYHESIPGHHLQIAISQELPEVPAFRRHGGFTAFVEGWALYTERLADEMGLYSGDEDRMGMLSFDAWRSARLVVDTGVHDLGWSREQAVAFMRENTPLAENNIDNEVDRYITWPGQALAYKTGQLEILRLRAQARDALGDRFVPSRFHDLILGAGSLPLPILRARVEAWIAREQGRSDPAMP